MWNTGMVLGKFLPPHLGHVHMIEFARACVKDLTIVVGTLDREPIPGHLRVEWMRELFPNARVVHLSEDLPQDPSETPEFWPIWRTVLQRVLPHSIQVVVASEAYGERLASELGGRFIQIDANRCSIPVSGTKIRGEPWKYWDYIPRPVRPHFLRRVCFVGPESTGKTTLARQLAGDFGSCVVPEYAASYIARKGSFTPDDALEVLLCQRADEWALSRSANRLLFCDSDALTTQAWCERLFGFADERIVQEARQSQYDLTFLCAPDTPFVMDAHRYFPEQSERDAMFRRMRDLLESYNRPYILLEGDWDQRYHCARKSVEALRPPSFL